MHSAIQPTRTRAMSRAQRRALVLATYVGFALFIVVMYAGYMQHWPATFGIPAIVLLVAVAAAFIQLVRAPGYAADTAGLHVRR